MYTERNGTTYSIDIETVSQGKRANEYTDQKKYKLGNVKDPEKIKEALQKKKDEERNKHGLSWVTGKICSIAIVDIFGDKETQCFYGADESEILLKASEYMSGQKLIGKTSQLFDFPFLVGRYIANGLTVPMSLKSKGLLYDIDNIFGWSSQSNQRGTLDSYAHGINYKQKPMHGSAVQGLYDTILDASMKGDDVAVKAGWQQLRDYNIHDCMIVKALALAYYGEGGM